MTKSELLANIRTDRAALDEIVVAISDDVLEEAGPGGGWSVKDHLSHIAAWERMIVAHLSDGSDAAIAGMAPDVYVRAPLDRINSHLYALHRDDLVASARVEFAEAHAAIVAYIDGMPEARLADVYWDDDPAERIVLAKVSGDTYLHYREHAGWIAALVAGEIA